jgi:heme/copper-type cytochrome/quinol oxidase subunit 3
MSAGGAAAILIMLSWLWLIAQAAPHVPGIALAAESGAPPPADPWLFAASFSLLLGGAGATWAGHALGRGRPGILLTAHLAALAGGLGFVAVQTVRFGEAAVVAFGGPGQAQLWWLAGIHASFLIGAIALLGLSVLFALTSAARTPAPEAALWNWHVIDTAWLGVLVLAFHGDLMGYP